MNRRTSIQVLEIPAGRRGERGFALLEILVAFVVLALGLGAISTGIAVAMRSDGRVQASRVALRLAQSRLEAAGIAGPLVPGHREGRMGNNYKWQETITAVHTAAKPPEVRDGQMSQAASNAAISPFWVEVAVQAADGTVARLSGLKLASVPRP
jgi:general secretion pathway protein I